MHRSRVAGGKGLEQPPNHQIGSCLFLGDSKNGAPGNHPSARFAKQLKPGNGISPGSHPSPLWGGRRLPDCSCFPRPLPYLSRSLPINERAPMLSKSASILDQTPAPGPHRFRMTARARRYVQRAILEKDALRLGSTIPPEDEFYPEFEGGQPCVRLLLAQPPLTELVIYRDGPAYQTWLSSEFTTDRSTFGEALENAVVAGYSAARLLYDVPQHISGAVASWKAASLQVHGGSQMPREGGHSTPWVSVTDPNVGANQNPAAVA